MTQKTKDVWRVRYGFSPDDDTPWLQVVAWVSIVSLVFLTMC